VTLGTTMLRLMLWRIGYALRPDAAAELRRLDEPLPSPPVTPAAG
jgi:hypothetical protein